MHSTYIHMFTLCILGQFSSILISPITEGQWLKLTVRMLRVVASTLIFPSSVVMPLKSKWSKFSDIFFFFEHVLVYIYICKVWKCIHTAHIEREGSIYACVCLVCVLNSPLPLLIQTSVKSEGSTNRPHFHNLTMPFLCFRMLQINEMILGLNIPANCEW
jgi:hypothetical protein